MSAAKNVWSVISTFQKVRDSLVGFNTRFWSSETAVLIATSAFVGLAAGLSAIFFRWLIEYFEFVFFDGGGTVLSFLGPFYVILIPVLGGLVIGPLIYFMARDATRFGVPEVMEAVAFQGGRMRPMDEFIKMLSSSICIGTGGSVGRVGPVVQIGSALGSALGQALRFSDDRIRTLVACGGAGGIAATFNAPIAGVIFAMEVILREFSTGYFSMVVIASVAASQIARAFQGDFLAFQVPAYTLISPWELVLYALLGLLAALVAYAFIYFLYWMMDLFDNWEAPKYLTPAVGGLGVGVLGFFIPQVFGVGFDTIERTLQGGMETTLLAGLLLAKFLATAICLGSGGSGGVFAPLLFFGAVLGGGFGNIAHEVMPSITALPGAYALVGMAAVFSGAVRAPMTAVFIIFEMTQDYRIILPLMFTTVVSTLLAARFHKENIYTLKLARRGVNIGWRREQNFMRYIPVESAMTPFSQLTTVKPRTSFGELAQLFQNTHLRGFAMVGEKDGIRGIVSLSDMERAVNRGKATGTAEEIATTRLITVYSDESLEEVIRKIGMQDVSRVPVVDRMEPGRLLGMVHRADVIRAYTVALREDQSRQDESERLRLERVAGAEMIEIDLSDGDAAVDRRLEELRIPPDCLIITIRRAGEYVVPRGETEFLSGDHVVALATPGKKGRLMKCLLEGED